MAGGTLLQLPLELLREIMSHLSLQDIISLTHSCKLLSRMVCEPALRSYHSRMGDAGLGDHPPPDGLSIRERLAALDRWESAWDNAHISIVADPVDQQQGQQVVELTDSNSESRVLVVDGFYVEMHPLADSRADGCGYRYLDLSRSSLRPEDVRSVWHPFQQRAGILCYAFAIDKHDLFAVLIEYVARFVTLPLLSRSAGLHGYLIMRHCSCLDFVTSSPILSLYENNRFASPAGVSASLKCTLSMTSFLLS
jgi:hypothetical protein